MAKEFREAAKRGDELGLNESEVAFYDALADNESAVRELGDETLKKIAHRTDREPAQQHHGGLAEARERARQAAQDGAHHLRRYKYPPDQQEEAIRLVLEQAERLSDAWTR